VKPVISGYFKFAQSGAYIGHTRLKSFDVGMISIILGHGFPQDVPGSQQTCGKASAMVAR
jgi:hypothetical protein